MPRLAHLLRARVHEECEVRQAGKLGVCLVLRVHEVLNLHLRELTHAQQPRLGRDLVTEALPDLRGRKRQLTAVEVQQVAAHRAHPLTSAQAPG